MPTYVALRPWHKQNVSLEPGEELPEHVLARMDPDSWVQQGHILKLTAAEARSLASLREKRNTAREDFEKAEQVYNDKLADIEKRKGAP